MLTPGIQSAWCGTSDSGSETMARGSSLVMSEFAAWMLNSLSAVGKRNADTRCTPSMSEIGLPAMPASG